MELCPKNRLCPDYDFRSTYLSVDVLQGGQRKTGHLEYLP